MVNLSVDDKRGLLKLLMPLPILANERGREAVLVNANLEELRPHLDLSGASSVAIPLMISFLCSYGRLTYEHEALGRFLNTLKDFVGIEDQELLDNIIAKYSLMIPVARLPIKVDWAFSVTSSEVLEKIIGENTLRPIAFFQQGLDASRSVVYIEISSGETKWSGTGFMISPNLLLTNHHVLPDKSLLSTAIFRFNYQVDSKGNPQVFEDYSATKDTYFTNQALDYALVGLADNPGHKWGYLTLKSEIPMLGNRVNIIQHPSGLPKQLSIQNNFIKFADTVRIQYVTSTLPGSSGSPIFNNNWEIIGIHHAGGWLPETEGGPLYFRNEGILIKAILEDLPSEIKERLVIL